MITGALINKVQNRSHNRAQTKSNSNINRSALLFVITTVFATGCFDGDQSNLRQTTLTSHDIGSHSDVDTGSETTSDSGTSHSQFDECPPDLTSCENICTDTKRSWKHCGFCHKTCPAGNDCMDGVCATACREGHTDCNGTCANLESDPLHCGICDQQCPSGTKCSSGICTLNCSTEMIQCNNSCINPQNDRWNCGNCGQMCHPGYTCHQGSCVLDCPVEQKGCDDLCVDLSSDPNHCGSCNTQCPEGTICHKGECATTVTSITISNLTLLLPLGDTSILTTTVLPPTASNKTVIWTSSAPDKVAVNRSGHLQAINTGEAIITASTDDGGYQAQCLVTVNIPPATVTIAPSDLTMEAGQIEWLTATIQPPEADKSMLEWSSTAPEIAQVGKDGRLLGLSAGNTIITVTDHWTGLTDQANVQVHHPISGVMIQPAAVTMAPGTQVQLNAVTVPHQPEGPVEAVWTTTDTSVAITSPNGLLHAVAPGHATIELIIVSSDGSSTWRANGTVAVVVAVTGVELDPKAQAIILGASHPIQATILPDHPSVDKRLRWSSSNPNIATVGYGDGVITGVSFGSTTITVSTPDGRLYDWATFHVINGPASATTTTIPHTASHAATSITTGANHTCAIPSSGSLWCWGNNSWRQLGNLSNADSSVPVRVSKPSPPPDRWVDVAAGLGHTCGLGVMISEEDDEESSGTIWCWGQNNYGQHGNGNNLFTTTPNIIEAENGGSWNTIARTGAGAGEHVCAIGGDSSLWCWGRNHNGQLGDGTTLTKLIPTKISAGPADNNRSEWTSACTGYQHTCAIDSNQDLWCWGANGSGQLGLGATAPEGVNQVLPSLIDQGNDGSWQEVYCGFAFSCALRFDGSLWCWGDNYFGQVGDGTRQTVNSPTMISPPDMLVGGWKQVSTGRTHTCAVGEDYSLWCWGENGDGRLGDRSTTDRAVPTRSQAQWSWADVTCGTAHTCGMRTDGTFWCWGDNSTGKFSPDERLRLSINPAHVPLPTAP